MLSEKAPGTNLMMNPLFYATMMGWNAYAFSYPEELQALSSSTSGGPQAFAGMNPQP